MLTHKKPNRNPTDVDVDDGWMESPPLHTHYVFTLLCFYLLIFLNVSCVKLEESTKPLKKSHVFFFLFEKLKIYIFSRLLLNI